MRTSRKLVAILGAGLLSLGVAGCDVEEGFLDGIVDRIVEGEIEDGV